MSKYTEAETKIKKIMCEEIDRLPSHFDGEGNGKIGFAKMLKEELSKANRTSKELS